MATDLQLRVEKGKGTNVQTTLVPLDFDLSNPDGEGDLEAALPEPSFSRFKVSVELGSATRQLYMRHKVRVLLVDDKSGEVLCGARGHVDHVGFPLLKKQGHEWTERVHKIKFTEPLDALE